MSWLSAETVRFLAELRDNNDREWFAGHRDRYEQVLKHPAEAFAAAMADELSAWRGVQHGYRIFRIHRDVRFSKDKTPFNAHLHISFAADGGCTGGAPVWMFGLDPDGVTLGAGIFAFAPAQLERWRALCAGRGGVRLASTLAALAHGGIRLSDPELKRVPAPYAVDHPASTDLRRKGLTAWIDDPEPQLAFGIEGPANCVRRLANLREVFDILADVGNR
jgi:uncharacterized protein (TIGR02453 family)